MTAQTEREFAASFAGIAWGLTSVDVLVTAEADPKTGRAAWHIRRGRFNAWLSLMNCICRETPGQLTVCTKLVVPNICYGRRPGHCHAWHPEKVAEYVKVIGAKKQVHRPTQPKAYRYAAEAYVWPDPEAHTCKDCGVRCVPDAKCQCCLLLAEHRRSEVAA